MKRWLLAATCMTFACGGQPDRSHESTNVDRVQHSLNSHSAAVDDMQNRVSKLGAAWDDVRLDYERAARQNDAAIAALTSAATTSGRTSAQYAEASRVAEKAAGRWRLVQSLVVTAAVLDASKMDAARGATRKLGGASPNCDAGMSTAAYRALLIAKGVVLNGIDIDHIVPKSLGGADHPDNYQLLPESVNRSLGNAWNEEKCLGVGEERCGRAIAASRKCGSLRGLGFSIGS